MSTPPDQERRPVHCRCGDCRHVWVAAYLPMPAGDFARLLKRAACPNCGATTRLYLYEPGRAPAEPTEEA